MPRRLFERAQHCEVGDPFLSKGFDEATPRAAHLTV
jgi:hypothetical protein